MRPKVKVNSILKQLLTHRTKYKSFAVVVGLLPLCERNHRCRNDESVWWGIVVSRVLLFVMLVCLEWYKGLKQKEKGILIGILTKHVTQDSLRLKDTMHSLDL